MTTKEVNRVKTALRNVLQKGREFKKALEEVEQLDDFIEKNQEELNKDPEIKQLLDIIEQDTANL